MIKLYARMIEKGQLSIEDVPQYMRDDVEKVLSNDKKDIK